MWWPPVAWYEPALIIIVVLTAISGRLNMILAALAITLDHEAMQAVGDQYCVMANMAIDITFAEVTLATCCGRRCGYLMMTWTLLMAAHVGYILSRDRYIYWYVTSFGSWAQVALLGTWGGMDGGRRIRLGLGYWLHRVRMGFSLGVARCHQHDGASARTSHG
jgi:hypothetical protein